jgi:uncharacterized protein YjeT (DUF2065 family)
MIHVLAFDVVLLAGIYFVSLAAVALAAPNLATRFLLGHARTALVHYLELFLRLAVGAAFLLHGPSTRFPTFFAAFGWVLVATTAVLFVVPWRWHQRFAQRSVPQAVRYLRLIGVASFFLGTFVLVAALSNGP